MLKLNLGKLDRPAVTAGVLANMRFKGSNERVVGQDGDTINAGSTKELMSRLVELAAMIQSGSIQNETMEVASSAERLEVLRSAYYNPEEWNELSSAIAADVTGQVARMGFMRSLLARGNVSQGSVVRVRVRNRLSEAVVSVAPSKVAIQQTSDLYAFPTEVNIMAMPLVSEIELMQGSEDILAERHAEALESIMVGEDRMMLDMARIASGIYNTQQIFAAITPGVLTSAQEALQTWAVPPTSLLMSFSLIAQMNTSTDFNSGFFEPVSRLSLVTTGTIGQILGLQVMTDGYRSPRLQVLKPSELFVFGSPEMVGAYTDRGPVVSEPVGPTTGAQGAPSRGMHMREIVSMAVANPFAVSYARKA